MNIQPKLRMSIHPIHGWVAVWFEDQMMDGKLFYPLELTPQWLKFIANFMYERRTIKLIRRSQEQ